MFYRSTYRCEFNDTTVEGLKPSKHSTLLIITKPYYKILPNSDGLILEDSDGYRYRRSLYLETSQDSWVFEML